MGVNVAGINAKIALLRTIGNQTGGKTSDLLRSLEKQEPVPNEINLGDGGKRYLEIVENDDLPALKTRMNSMLLNEQFGPSKSTLLHMASSTSATQIINDLVSEPKINVNLENSAGETAIMVAVSRSPTDSVAFYSALLICQNENVLVEKKTKNFNFPLLQAIRRGFKSTAKFLFSSRFQRSYTSQDVLIALTASAVWNQIEIGLGLIDQLLSTGRHVLTEILKSTGQYVENQVSKLLNGFSKLSISSDLEDENEHVSLDAAENKLIVGSIVQTLSKETMRRHFPAVTKDSDIAMLADQRAVIHSISGDRLYLEFLESNHMAVVKSASVMLVQFGQTVKLDDGAFVTIGRFVKVADSKEKLEEVQGSSRWRHGMERMCGKTGRIVRIGKEGLVQVQFSVGSRYYYDPKALTSSIDDHAEGCDGSGNWFRKGSVVRVNVPVSLFVQLQKELNFPTDDSNYKQLVGKLVQVDKVSIKSFSMQKILRVVWKGGKYNLNGQVVSVVDNVAPNGVAGAKLGTGDKVTLIADKLALKNLQSDNFGGLVQEILEQKDGVLSKFVLNSNVDLEQPLVQVKFSSGSFYFFNPKCLVPVGTRKDTKGSGGQEAPSTGTTSGKLALIKRSQLKCIDKLGEGGFGAVYKGTWDLGNGKVKTVAVKQMNYGVTSSNEYDDVIKEAKIQFALNHPNIVSLFGVSYGPTEDLWLVMKLVPGMDLQSILFPSSGRRTFDLPFRFKVKISLDMSYAIAFIHSQGFVHQDIKPSNMMVDQRTGTLYVCDFGVTRYLGNMDITTFATKFTQNFGGTLLYVAPECLRQNEDGCHVRPTFKSDVWSLGATFYEIFAERHLFDDGMKCFQCKLQNDSELIQKLVISFVPKEVRTIIRRTLDFVSHRRPNAHQLTDFFHSLESNGSSNNRK